MIVIVFCRFQLFVLPQFSWLEISLHDPSWANFIIEVSELPAPPLVFSIKIAPLILKRFFVVTLVSCWLIAMARSDLLFPLSFLPDKVKRESRLSPLVVCFKDFNFRTTQPLWIANSLLSYVSQNKDETFLRLKVKLRCEEFSLMDLSCCSFVC